MTTPAVSINDQTSYPGSIAYWDPTLKQWKPATTTSPKVSSIHQESRPASGNHPIQSDGYRAPGSWSHSYTFVNPNPLGNQVAYWISSNPSDQTLVTDTACFNGTSYGLPSFPSYLENVALYRALDKLKNQRWNVSQLYVERKKAIKTATSAIRTANKQIKAFKQQFPNDWRRLAENTGRKLSRVSPRFLELVYGLVPLLNTVYGACQDLHDREKAAAKPYRASVVGRSVEIQNLSWQKTSGQTAYWGYQCEGKIEHRCLIHLEYVLDSPSLALASHLGITNPLVVLWNVYPWTYVADWFLPVSKYLSALDADLGFTWKSGTSTHWSKLELNGDRIVPFGPLGNGYVIPYALVPYRERRFTLDRSVYVTAPRIPLPQWKNPASALHLAEALALLQGNFFRIVKHL